MVDVSADGEPSDYEYRTSVDEGDDWRLTLETIDGQFSPVNVDVPYEGPLRPSHVVVEVERVDAEGS